MYLEKLCLILVVTAFYGVVAQNNPTYKQWIPNTNYNNPNNWNKKRLPCDQDVVSFDNNNGNYTVFLQDSLAVKEVIFPVNGDFVFEEGFTISAPAPAPVSPSSSPSSTPTPCISDGTPNIFVGDIPKNWFSPSNWMVVNGPSGSGIGTGSIASNVMQAEQIPCVTDTVIFPSNAFAANITLPVTIGSIMVNGQQYLGQQFANYLTTSAARTQFYFGFGSSITVQDRGCTNSSGCPCGYSGGAFQREICKQSICPAVSCASPLNPPLGSCCSICGTVMQFSISSTFNLTIFEQQIKTSFLNSAANVLYNIQTTGNGTILLILQDKNNGSTSGDAAVALGKNIFDGIKSDTNYNITSETLRGSDGTVIISRPTASNNAVGIGIGVAFAVIAIIILLSVAYFFYFKRKSASEQELTTPQPSGISKRMNTFGRRMRNTFRTRTSSGLIGGMELGTRSEAEQSVVDVEDKPGISYENPLYNTTVKEESETVFKLEDTKDQEETTKPEDVYQTTEEAGF